MLIAKIVNSNSHIDYAARILDSMETDLAPTSRDYHFGQFVRISVDDRQVIGIIYNSLLINPEYGNYGPRLSTPPELNAVFSPDYLNEQGVLIGILLLGWREGESYRHGVPGAVIPTHAQVETMSPEEVLAFHHDRAGALNLAYYPQIATHAKLFAFPLLDAIVSQLEPLLDKPEQARLRVLRQTLAWQQTVGKIVL